MFFFKPLLPFCLFLPFWLQKRPKRSPALIVSPGKIQHTVFLSFCEKNKKIKKNRELDGQTVDF